MKLFDTAVSAYYSVKSQAKSFATSQSGVTAIEYAVVAAGVAAVVLVVFQDGGTFANALSGIFNRLSGKMNDLVQ